MEAPDEIWMADGGDTDWSLFEHCEAIANNEVRYIRADLHEKEVGKLRKLLWLNHGCDISALYGDDGEMQCCSGRHISIDFKRDSPKAIKQKIVLTNLRAIQAAKEEK